MTVRGKAAVAIAVLVVTGCGTTVPVPEASRGARSGLSAPGAVANDGLSAEPPAGSSTPSSAPSAGTFGAPTAGPGSAPGGEPGGDIGVSAPVPSGTVGPGVTARAINIGIEYIANGSQANAAVGGSSFTTGNLLAENNAVIADLNHHGGIAGRQVVASYATLDPTSTQPVELQEQAACTALTQDHHVFAVLAAEAHDNFIQCVQNAGAATVLDAGLTDAGSAVFAAHPSYIEPSSINLDRLAAAEVQVLSSQNYFSGWNAASGTPGALPVKVGILTFDDPRYAEAVNNAMRPALARLGHPVATQDVQSVFEAQREADAGQESAQVVSAVLRLRQDGVTHVLFLEHGGLPVAFFLNAAQGQGYRPRYGFTTQDAAEALIQGGEVPRAQMNGAEGIGWVPAADLPFGGANPYVGSTGARRCLGIMSQAGQAPTSADALLMAFTICDQIWFIQWVIESGGPALTRSAFVDRVDGLGRSFPSVLTLQSSFSSTRHDGAGQARAYAYSGACGCWSYYGSPVELP